MSFVGRSSDPPRQASDDARPITGVLATFGRSRLLAFDRDAVTRGPTVEVSHEALLREWPLLRDWLRESRGEVRLQRQLAQAAAEWTAANRDPSFLLSGARLAQFEAWRANATVSLTADEQILIDASLAERERRATAEAARVAREVALQRRARRILQALVIVFLGAAVIAGGLAWWANDRRMAAEVAEDAAAANLNLSEAQRLAAESRTLILEHGDASTTALLALRSLNHRYTPQGDGVLSQALFLDYPERVFRGHTGMLWDVGFLPGRSSIYTVGSDDVGTIRLWDLDTGAMTRSFDVAGGCFEADVSFDGRHIAAACWDGAVHLWRLDRGTAIRQLPHQATDNPRVRFSPDGRHLMSGGTDAAARLWNVETGTLIHTYEADNAAAIPALAFAFTPDGRQVVIGGQDNVVRQRDVSTGAVLREFRGHTDWAWGVAVSPDGRLMVSTSLDPDGARLWDLQTGDLIRRFPHPNATSYDVEFSADGRYLVTGGWDATARLWDVETGLEVRRFTHTQVVWGVALSSDGQHAVTGSWVGIARLWSLGSQQGLVRFAPGKPPTYGVLSPDDSRLALASGDPFIRLISTATGVEMARVPGHVGLTYGMAFSSNGRYLATTSSADSVTRVSDTVTGATVWEDARFGGQSVMFSADSQLLYVVGTSVWIHQALTGELIRTLTYSENQIYGALDPGNTAIASSLGDNPLLLIWDLRAGEVVATFTASGVTRAFAFSPDGQYLATAGDGGTPILWNTSTWEEVRRFVGHAGTIERALAYSLDGRYLASGSMDRTVRVWDVATGQQLRYLTGFSDGIANVGFTRDGSRLLIVTVDGTAQLTYVHLDDAIDDLCRRLITDLDSETRARYGITDTTPTCQP